MKITKSRLKQLIKEELDALHRAVEDVPGSEFEYEQAGSPEEDDMQRELEALVNAVGTFDNTGYTKAAIRLLSQHAGKGTEDVAWKVIISQKKEGDYESMHEARKKKATGKR